MEDLEELELSWSMTSADVSPSDFKIGDGEELKRVDARREGVGGQSVFRSRVPAVEVTYANGTVELYKSFVLILRRGCWLIF